MSARVTVSLEGVTKYFGSRSARHTAVDDLTIAFDDTLRVGVVGESGSGKSTLARMVVGLEQPSVGRVVFNGEPLEHLLTSRSGRTDFRRAVQYIAQDTTSSFDPRRTLLDSVMQPLLHLAGLDRRTARDRALAVVASLGLPPELAFRHPAHVSGGQRQRFAIARALVVRPRLLVCDEVVSALDVSVQGAILNLLKRYCVEEGAGLLFVSHGLPATGFVASDLVVMHHGAIVEHGPSVEVLTRPTHPYTVSLVAAHDARPAGGGATPGHEAARPVRQRTVPA